MYISSGGSTLVDFVVGCCPCPYVFREVLSVFRILCVPLALYIFLVVCWGIALLEINS